MLSIENVTWKDERKTDHPTAIIFESLYIPSKPLYILYDEKSREVLSLKYYNLKFETKTMPLCLAQYINKHGQIEQVAIAGTGHENIELDGIEYSELLTK
ncbi:MAG: hypothetical protein Q8R96_11515 [Bacteroidota bacterium]|nr:hypothetical protein [Bacteroidota bacterium]